jgi:hypothetical protein
MPNNGNNTKTFIDDQNNSSIEMISKIGFEAG